MATGNCEWGDAERVCLKSDKEVVVENSADWGKRRLGRSGASAGSALW